MRTRWLFVQSEGEHPSMPDSIQFSNHRTEVRSLTTNPRPQMNGVHASLLAKPTCGVDKWLDNHHAYDANSVSTSSIVTYLDSGAGADTYYY